MATSRNTDRIRYRYGICLNDNCEKCKSKEVQEIPARKDFVCQNPECGKPLRECPPPKKGGNTKLIGILIGGLVLLVVIGGIIAYCDGSTTARTSVQIAPVDSDSIRAAQMEVENQRLKDSLAAKSVQVSHVDSDSIRVAQVEAENLRLKDSLAAVASAAEAEKKKAAEKPSAVSTPVEKHSSTPKPVTSGGSKNFGYATFKGSWPNDVNGRMIFKTSHIIDSRDPKGRVAEAGDYVIGEWSDGHLVQGIWYGADNQVKGSVIIGK